MLGKVEGLNEVGITEGGSAGTEVGTSVAIGAADTSAVGAWVIIPNGAAVVATTCATDASIGAKDFSTGATGASTGAGENHGAVSGGKN